MRPFTSFCVGATIALALALVPAARGADSPANPALEKQYAEIVSKAYN